MDYLWLLLDKWSDLQCNIPPYCACEYDREILHFVCTHIRLSIQVRFLSLSLTHALKLSSSICLSFLGMHERVSSIRIYVHTLTACEFNGHRILDLLIWCVVLGCSIIILIVCELVTMQIKGIAHKMLLKIAGYKLTL